MTDQAQETSVSAERMSEMTKCVGSRGLWIGLLADECAVHTDLISTVLSKNPDNFTASHKSPHVTLAHLGRSNGLRELSAALSSADVLASITKARSVSVEGMLRLSRHVAVAVETSWIDVAAARLDAALHDRHVMRDKRFAGLRHVTLGELLDDRQPTLLPRCARYSLHFSRVIVVCGDVVQEFRTKLGDVF